MPNTGMPAAKALVPSIGSIIHVICCFVFPICSTLLILLYNIKKDDHLDNVTDLGYVEQD